MTRRPDMNREGMPEPGQRSWTRFLPVAILVAGFALFFALGLDRYLSLAALADHREALGSFTRDHLLAALVLFGLLYVAVVAFSLPGGAVMTIAGGFLFGTWLASAVTVLSATLGALVVFLAARTAFADLLRDRAGPWLKRMEKGFREDGASYMLVMRLVPIFPFFVVNVAPAFLGVSTRLYLLTTLFGIIPGTVVYASVGNGLGAILDTGRSPDLGIIFDPAILLPILGLAALAMIPVIYRKFKKGRPAA